MHILLLPKARSLALSSRLFASPIWISLFDSGILQGLTLRAISSPYETLTCAALLVALQATAGTIEGRVVVVADGDTVTVLDTTNT
jgi:endonuclease YncB( thermonuclease family)